MTDRARVPHRRDKPVGAVEDADRFPRLARYLSVLPEGLDSYPHLQAKASPLRRGVDRFPVDRDVRGVPERVRELLVHPPSMNVWLPATLANAAYLAVADFHGWSAEQYEEASYRVNFELYRSPMYRALMILASPERLLATSQKRWPAFHKGSMLAVRLEGRSATLTLPFPRHSFPELCGWGFLGSLRAAIEGARGRNVRASVVEWTPTEGTLAVTWR